MQEVLREFLNLIFPRLCLLCEQALVRSETHVCTSCLASLPHLHFHEGRSEILQKKLSSLMPVKEVLAYLLYQKSGSTQKLLQLLKYKDYPELGEYMGRHFGARLAENGYQEAFDLIVPVPLHVSRYRQRGYNQSARFAAGLSDALGIPVKEDLLKRVKASESQTRKSRLDRWLNVNTIFEVEQKESVRGKRILLVDDVVTTGATLEASGEALLAADCKQLSVGAIAIA